MKKLFLLTLSCLLLVTSAFGNENVVVVNTPSNPVPISGSFAATIAGATHEVNSQVTAGVVAGTLLAARPTRVGCIVKNTDTGITVYIGGATVTAANGLPLKPGESCVITAITLVQVIAASGTPVVALWDEFD